MWKNENDLEKSKYVTVENKKNKFNKCIKYISALKSCKLSLKFKYYFIQVAFKKPNIVWHLTKLGRCQHFHELHFSFLLSMLLSVKFNDDHKGRFLVWHINYSAKNLSLSV